MKSVIGLAATTILLVACQSNIYHIKGEAKTFADGTMLYLTTDLNGDGHPVDSVIVNEGHFSTRGMADTTQLCKLYAATAPEAGILFFIGPGNTYIELSDKPGCSRVSGTKVNNEWQALCDTVAKYDRQIRQLFHPESDSISPRKLHAETERIYAILNRRIDEAAHRNGDNAFGQFISSHKEKKEAE